MCGIIGRVCNMRNIYANQVAYNKYVEKNQLMIYG